MIPLLFSSKKTKLSIGGILSLIFLGLFVFRKKEDPEPDSHDVIHEVEINNSNLSDQQAKVLADLSYTAMNGAFTNTDFLFNNLFILNNPSFDHVFKVFGVRDDENLAQWLLGDLSNSQYKKFSDKFNIL